MSESNKLPKSSPGRGWILLIVGGLVVTVMIFASMPPLVDTKEQKNRVDRDIVFNLLNSQEKSWNAGDLDGFMLGYWNDKELTFYSDNTIEKGYEPLKQRYQRKYKNDGKEMGKLTFSDLDIKPTSAEFVVVRGRWKVEKSTETRDGLFTLWIEKKPGNRSTRSEQ